MELSDEVVVGEVITGFCFSELCHFIHLIMKKTDIAKKRVVTIAAAIIQPIGVVARAPITATVIALLAREAIVIPIPPKKTSMVVRAVTIAHPILSALVLVGERVVHSMGNEGCFIVSIIDIISYFLFLNKSLLDIKIIIYLECA